MYISQENDMYNLNDILISVLNNLNTIVLNKSFTRLFENDLSITTDKNYIPNIWENKWFNDDSIAGYSRGHCCWRNSITSFSDFLDTYGDQVYLYAQEKSTRLQVYLSQSWSLIKSSGTTSLWIDKYYNVVSGYSEYNEETRSTTQYYERLYDFGDAGSTSPSLNRILIFISLVGDNKSFLSDSSSWESVVLSDDTLYLNYIKTLVEQTFNEHVDNYHFSGLLKSQADVDKYLESVSLSNFNVDKIKTNRLKSHYSYINSDGFDYVLKFGKKTEDYVVNGSTYKLYKWFRLWNSGYLEHGGTVPDIRQEKDSYDISDYYISVDLNWNIGNNNLAPIYSYPLISNSFYGNVDGSLYYSGMDNDEVKESYLNTKSSLLQYLRYTVEVCPVSFNVETDMFLEKVFDFSYLHENGSGYGTSLSNAVNSFTSIDIHHIKGGSFCFTKNETDDLSKQGKITLYTYHTAGYSLLCFDDIQVNGLLEVYEYTGSEICPQNIVAKLGAMILRRDHDYELYYEDNIACGTATMYIDAIYPYSGKYIETFYISKFLARCSIQNLTRKIRILSLDDMFVDPTFDIIDNYYTPGVASHLHEGTDYDFTVSPTSPTVIPGNKIIEITGLGDYIYSDHLHENYLLYISVDDIDISLKDGVTEYTFTGNNIEPLIVVTLNGKTVNIAYNDYTVYSTSYSNNRNVGTANAIVLVNDNDGRTKSTQFTIIGASFESLDIILSTSTLTYNGYPLYPSITLKLGSYVLVYDVDYTKTDITEDMTNVGDKVIRLSGRTTNIVGSRDVNFEILKYPISNTAGIAVTGYSEKYTYTSHEIKPNDFTVVFNGWKTLNKDIDYTLEYLDSSSGYVNVGTKRVNIVGQGNFSGVNTISFEIVLANMNNSTINMSLTIEYTGRDIRPSELVVKIGDIEVNQDDYSILYTSSEYVNPGLKQITITSTSSNYTGYKVFNISVFGNLSDCDVTGYNPVYAFDGLEKHPSLIVMFHGIRLFAGVDYLVTYPSSSYINPGDVEIRITLIRSGYYTGSKSIFFSIRDTSNVIVTYTDNTKKENRVIGTLDRSVITD